MSEQEPMAYAGTSPCGCCNGLAVDAPEHRAGTAREIAKWIKWGMTIERVTIEKARTMFGPGCEKCWKPKKRPRAKLVTP